MLTLFKFHKNGLNLLNSILVLEIFLWVSGVVILLLFLLVMVVGVDDHNGTVVVVIEVMKSNAKRSYTYKHTLTFRYAFFWENI